MRKTTIAVAFILTFAACETADTERLDSVEADSLAAVDTPTATGANPTPADPPSAGMDHGGEPSSPRAATADSLRVALDRLVSGAADRAGSEFSWFSGETARVIRGVSVDAAGNAVVDFVDLRSVIPNASSSAGSQQLLAELNAAVFSVGGVRSVEYRMNGDCELLGEWLQYGVCLKVDRP